MRKDNELLREANKRENVVYLRRTDEQAAMIRARLNMDYYLRTIDPDKPIIDELRNKAITEGAKS